ncbi:MAG: cytochrome c [Bacteroidia bacterium]|nr:cytochrome c [Bacteroidia bacterium]MBT8229272.1 cytochrome c [Bacteroidia bacterium]NNK89201.1 cytochrome c [Saprospiraceae bacterium]
MFYSFVISPDQSEPWEVPAKYENMENPEEASSESLKIGKSLWKKHCSSCHGKEGLGDGHKAEQLDTPAGDFTTEEFQAQSDGAIFYKSKFGRDEMPSYEKKIPYDEDMWHLVNYMRTFE